MYQNIYFPAESEAGQLTYSIIWHSPPRWWWTVQ